MQLQRLTAASVLSLAFVTACGQDSGTAAPTGVDKAAVIAKEIKADPSQAEAVLKKHGMTEEQFEALMFQIADDPKQAEAFANKMGG